MHWLLFTLLSFIATAIVLIVVDRLNIGLKVGSFTTAFLAAIVIAITNLILGNILAVLAFPINLVTLFCLSWLISWIIYAIVLYVASKIVSGFEILNFPAAIIAAAVIGIINWGIDWLLTQLNF